MRRVKGFTDGGDLFYNRDEAFYLTEFLFMRAAMNRQAHLHFLRSEANDETG